MIIEEFTLHMRRRKMAETTIRLRLIYLRKFESIHPDLTVVTEEQIEAFLDLYADHAPETQKSVLASLRVFYKWAARTERVQTDPACYVPNVVVPRRSPRMASEDQISMAIYNGTREQQAMVRLGAECGLRASEIASLHRNCRDGEWLTVIGKGSKQREVYLSAELQELLGSIERKGMRRGFYFPSECPSHHIHLSTVWRNIRQVLNSNPHSLRHRAGTVVYYDTGKDIRLAQVFLGHASSATTERYVHVERDKLRTAGEAARFRRVLDHPDILPAAA